MIIYHYADRGSILNVFDLNFKVRIPLELFPSRCRIPHFLSSEPTLLLYFLSNFRLLCFTLNILKRQISDVVHNISSNFLQVVIETKVKKVLNSLQRVLHLKLYYLLDNTKIVIFFSKLTDNIEVTEDHSDMARARQPESVELSDRRWSALELQRV